MISINKKRDTLYLGGLINEDHVIACIDFVQGLKKQRGTVIVNSEGGCQEDGFACYDVLRTVGGQLTAIGVGQVQSSALLPFLACDDRFATENCAFMIHHGTYEPQGPTHQREVLTVAKEIERLDERYIDVLATRTTLFAETVRMHMRHGHTFDAREATLTGYILGITTRIGGRK